MGNDSYALNFVEYMKGAGDGGMGAFAEAAGIALGNGTVLEMGFQDMAQCMMDNPVAERHGANGPPLAVMHLKGEKFAGPVVARHQLVLQFKKLMLLTRFMDFCLAAPLVSGHLIE